MRRAGILLHPTSLPGPGPCGDLGQGALDFLDWLCEAGCTLWQVLPLGPTGGGFSPYDSPGTLALGTHLLSLERLVQDGLLPAQALGDRPPSAADRVDLEALEGWHAPRVARAARCLAQEAPAALDTFRQAQPWVDDWALFRAVTLAAGTQRGWWDLPAPLRDRTPAALEAARRELRPAVEEHVAAQVLVHRQWQALRKAATDRGVRLVGDVPIFVSGAGADTWAHRGLFRWVPGPDGVPVPDPVAGVPPDYFSPQGQRWGNPLYAWEAHRAQGWRWWRTRIRAALAACHDVRIDHFRGFCASWAVPADALDATSGAWTPGPGRELFDAVAADLRADPPAGLDPDQPLPIIAEDLGIITPDVEALRDGLGLPGMKILQFAFGGSVNHPFLPHTWAHDRWVAYTGTHDNDTAAGWYAATDEQSRDHFRRYVMRDGQEPHWQLIQPLLASVARWAIVPLQDVLGLGSQARMNVPGLGEGNWTWRTAPPPREAAWRLRGLVEVYGRGPSQPPVR
ncbi:4-alpha-glucanotransferase [Myxococcota bacterium]|nr:4-alpha-glucanotransferase [Myxococcota bacterium]